MPLTNMHPLLQRAAKANRAVGAFSVANMEMILGVINAAEKANTPVILQIAEARLATSPLSIIGPAMLAAARNAKVDVAVHLDHGITDDCIYEAIGLGFSSVMFDGSHLTLDENIAKTKEITAYAHAKGVDVEAEIGRLTGGMGVDCAFECTGVAAGSDLCVRALRKTGAFTQIALYNKQIPFDWDLAMKKELELTTSIASERSSWLITLRLLQHKLIDPQPLVGEPLKLSEWKEGWRRLLSKEDFKILLYPTHD